MKVYLLIETGDSPPGEVVTYIQRLAEEDLKVSRAAMTFGPYEVIARLESDSMDRLDEVIHEDIARHPGVNRVTTCLVTTVPRAADLAHTQPYRQSRIVPVIP